MTTTPNQYQPFVEDGAIAPSSIAAFLPAWSSEPDIESLRERIEAEDKASEIVVLDPSSVDHDRAPSLQFIWGRGDFALECNLEIERATDSELGDTLPNLGDDIAPSEWCVRLSTYLGEAVLDDFHTQLRLLHLAVPDAVCVHDTSAVRTHDGDWLRDVATARVPPRPDTLYTVHVVHDAHRESVWLHTHGLHRCGSIELEMLDIPMDAISTFGNLLNVSAALFIERGVPLPEEEFDVGHGLTLSWLPWERAIDVFPEGALGRRDDRDQFHDMPSGVLVAGTSHPTPENVTVLQEILEDDPVMFHTTMETRRMSLMAKERFPRFRAVQRRFADREDWAFHVKLGYQVDDCPDEDDDNEHLWFDLHAIEGPELVATLLNQPHCIARMNAGDRGHHALDQLSDWSIESPHGLFDAATIGQLEELI